MPGLELHRISAGCAAPLPLTITVHGFQAPSMFTHGAAGSHQPLQTANPINDHNLQYHAPAVMLQTVIGNNYLHVMRNA